MNNELPLVSVIIPSYNHEKFIVEAIRSVWEQTYQNIELIVIDDGSKDGSVELLRQLEIESPIRMKLVVKENEGICKTLNLGLELAKGDYISLIASDDKMMPEKTSLLIKQFSTMPASVGMVYSDYVLIDEDGNKFEHASNNVDSFSGFLFEKLMTKGNFIQPLTIMVRKEVINKIGGFDEELRFEDLDFFFEVIKAI